MRNSEEAIKLFGMSNQLLTNELDKIETEFDISLEHRADKISDKDSEYFPQFEKSVRKTAKEMAAHYEVFYCLELSIRTLISEVLIEKAGVNWWEDENIVPEPIKTGAAARSQKERDLGITPRSDEPIDYTNFGELSEIIKYNWDVFGSVFNSVKAVERVLASLNTLRGPIAHCSTLAEDEVLRLKLSMKDWFRLME